ncbi:hypothetical protein H6503_00885 [Candidatus Woesearchaeota archaeon]|nr:hypothetical protein [Candidatus Woesearchaeota archaeon]
MKKCIGSDGSRGLLLLLSIFSLLLLFVSVPDTHAWDGYSCSVSDILIEGQLAIASCSWTWENNGTHRYADSIDVSISPAPAIGCADATYAGTNTTTFGEIASSPIDASTNLLFRVPNVEGSTPCNYSGSNGVGGESFILDINNGNVVFPDVGVYNATNPPGTGVEVIQEKVVNSRQLILLVNTTLPSNCTYHNLTLTESILNYNYTTAASGCTDDVECGALDTTNGYNHFQVLEYPYDKNKIRYGFYCFGDNGGTNIEGVNHLIFTIDTLAPNITSDGIFLEDSNTNVTQINGTASNPLVISSRDLEISFDTNEVAQCRYEIDNLATPSNGYDSMVNDITTVATQSHLGTITPPIGEYIYLHVACTDVYGNEDNISSSMTQTFPPSGSGMLFLLPNPICSDLNINASDVSDDDGGSIVLHWNNSNQDGAGEDYVTMYSIFRVNSTYPNSGILDVTALFETNDSIIPNLINITATNSAYYTWTDNSAIDGVGYYYYIVPRYYDGTVPSIMDNVLYNMSCSAHSVNVTSIDQGIPAPVTNLYINTSMSSLNGTRLLLSWNLSADDGNNSNDVSNYTIWRALFGTPEEQSGAYDNITTVTNGTKSYLDINASSLGHFVQFNETYCYIIETFDINSLSSNSSKICGSPNAQPFFFDMNITPDNATKLDEQLTCSVWVSDADGDTALPNNVNITWEVFHVSTFERTIIPNVSAPCTPIVKGAFQDDYFDNYTTECIANLTNASFSKGDKVWCIATAYDGEEYATEISNNTLYRQELQYINNSAPFASNINIFPNNSTHPLGSSDLSCNYTFEDIDGDSENVAAATFIWYVNNDGINSYVPLIGQTSSTLSSSYIDQNDLVICSVRTTDVDNSWLHNPLQATSYYNSSSVLVKDNSVPQIVNYTALPYPDSTQNITLVGNQTQFIIDWVDIDNDPVQTYVCDAFTTSESQGGSGSASIGFGDDASNNGFNVTFFTNETGRYVNKISIKPNEVIVSGISSSYSAPIYDMYVYEVDSVGSPISSSNVLIAQDNNNVFINGTYNNFVPEYNAQPLPNKYLAFVLCIDDDDDGTCDSNDDSAIDNISISASSTPGVYQAYSSALGAVRYDPAIKINYDSSSNGGCLEQSFCNTGGYSYETQQSCLYTVQATDNDTISYQVRVCDDLGACSIARTGTFQINHIPTMNNVYVGSDSTASAIGSDNNLMCMHMGASDEIVPKSDFVLDADGNWTIFGDTRNHIDETLSNSSTLIVEFDVTDNITFDTLVESDGVNNTDTVFEPWRDAIVVDVDDNQIYTEGTDIVLYNPFNSLNDGDSLQEFTGPGANISYHDKDDDGLFDWNTSNQPYPEDIIYNVGSSNSTAFDSTVNYTFMWYVKPANNSNWYSATDFDWYDNDFNDILTHGNTVPGDQWLCQVTPIDQYGYGIPRNSSAVTIGSGGVNPTLAPIILGVTDDSAVSSPTAANSNVTVTINYTDPDSMQVKAYICNSSTVIRNSGCFEKEFGRAINNGSINTPEQMNVSFAVNASYNMSGTSYTVMLCDPEYHCSDVSTGHTFYVNNPPYFNASAPLILPSGLGYFEFPRDYSTNNNLVCNITYDDVDLGAGHYEIQSDGTWGNGTIGDPNVTTSLLPLYSWYRNRTGTYELVYTNLTTPFLSSGATQNGDRWICQAQAFDNMNLTSSSTGKKNSSVIIIGSLVYDTSIPVITNVTTNSNVTLPINEGDVMEWHVQWVDFETPSATIFVCDSTNAVASGCLGKELTRTISTSASATLSWVVDLTKLENFTSSQTSYALNYSIFVVDSSGNMGNYTEGNYTHSYDDFAVNKIPSAVMGTIQNTSGLICDYEFSDSDNATSSDIYDSQYLNNNSDIKWYNYTSSGWVIYDYGYNNDIVPNGILHDGDQWICQVTPYDGYAYGAAKNSSIKIVGNMDPQVINWTAGYRHSPLTSITASSPLILGDMVYIQVSWFDANTPETTLYAISDGELSDAVIFASNTSSENPIEASFSSYLIANISGDSYHNEPDMNNFTNITFALVDGENITYLGSNISLYIDRKPEITSIIAQKDPGYGAFNCSLTIEDNDTSLSYDYNYNASLTQYSWYVDSGSGYVHHPEYNVPLIPYVVAQPGERWLCQAIPCDNYACGSPKNSSYITLANQTPEFQSIKIYNVVSGIYTELNASNPATYGQQILFNVTWDDSDLYNFGETVNMYVCENASSNKFGCLNTTTYCNSTSTTGVASCLYNTSNVNLTRYNLNNVSYSIVLYDSENLTSGHYTHDNLTVSNFSLNIKPNVTFVNITPAYPTNDTNLYCNYTPGDVDTVSPYGFDTATDTVYIKWYLDRDSSGFLPTIYTSSIITPDITQKHDRWLCQVTVNDGFVNSTAVNASTWVNIGNAINYTEYPNITSVWTSANSSHYATIDDTIQFSIAYADSDSPGEYARAFICNTTNIVNNTGCENKSFVNFGAYTSSNPIIAQYTIKESDLLIANGSGAIVYYVMVCDDTGYCSNISNLSSPHYFYINDKPNVTVSNITAESSGNLICNYNNAIGSINSSNSALISWYRLNATIPYCGDGVINGNEQCEVGETTSLTCNEFNSNFQSGEGELTCDYATCQYSTRYCIPVNPIANYCGNNETYEWEQCDGPDNNNWTYSSCTDIGSFTGGTLNCNSDCTLDISGCTGGGISFCGNGVIEYGEECDMIDDQIIGSYSSCSDFTNYLGGTLSCNPTTCQYDMSQCIGNADMYEDLQVYNVATLPVVAYTPGDIVVCKVTPYDGYNYGNAVFSPAFYSGISSIPNITEIIASYRTSSTTVIVNYTTPVEYGKKVNITLSWQDFEQYTPLGEKAKFFICNETGATYQGCLGTTLCSVPLTSNNPATCEFNTSLTNTNLTEYMYYAYVYDDSLNVSYTSGLLYLNRLPILSNYNITPEIPGDSQSLSCLHTNVSYDIINNNATGNTSTFNDTSVYYNWFYNRGGVWNEFDNSGNSFLSDYFTQLGDEWVCQITMSDGVASLPPVNTTSVFISPDETNSQYPSVTTLDVNGANTYYGDVYEETSGLLTIYKQDNTTNVGDNVDFIINWSDANQSSALGERVRVWICNGTNFTNNSGCGGRTLYFNDYTTADPIQISYTTQQQDNSVQAFSIYLCDDSGDCSNATSQNFTVNHPFNTSVRPEIVISTDLDGDDYLECDYLTQYDNGGNGETSDIGDDLATLNYEWYLDSGSGYIAQNQNTASFNDTLSNTDKVKCQIYAEDIYGYSSGYINSTRLDMQSVPIIWEPISNMTYSIDGKNYYVMNDNSNNSGANGTINITGYVPGDAPSNISGIAYHGYEVPYTGTNNSQLISPSTLQGTTTIRVATTNGTSYILVNSVSDILTKFNSSKYLMISNHNLSQFQRYDITNIFSPQPSTYRVDITPGLAESVNIGDIVYSYDREYPSSWFNMTLGIRNGINDIYIRSNINGTLGQARKVYVAYDSAIPEINYVTLQSPTQTQTPTFTFNVSDDFAVNTSSILVNVTNGTHHVYHFTPDTQLSKSALTSPTNVFNGNDISCTEFNSSLYSCSVTLSVSSILSAADTYTINITASDVLAQSTSNITSFQVSTTNVPAPVAFAQPVQNTTRLTFGLFIDSISAYEIQYAVGTAPYPDSGWNVTSNGGINLSEGTSGISLSTFTGLNKFIDYNYNIYYDEGEANVTSADLFFNSTDTIAGDGLGFKINSSTGQYYVDANNNSKQDPWESYNTTPTDFYINSSDSWSDSANATLTLALNTSELTLSENTPYRIAVRYLNSSSGNWSTWTYTNPILYKAGYINPTFNGPSSVSVYDMNTSAQEPSQQVDVAYNTDLRWYWTPSTPQSTSQGEYILRYEYAIGNEPWPYDGWNSVTHWTQVSNTTTTLTNLNSSVQSRLATGNTYYLTVRSLSSFGLYSQNSSSDGLVYDDQTAPEIQIIKVGGISGSSYFKIEQNTSPMTAIVYSPYENLSECGYSMFNVPFDAYYTIMDQCNPVQNDNRSYITCDLTDPNGNDLGEGNHTFYIACLDANGNANTLFGNSLRTTQAFDVEYSFADNPVVLNSSVLINASTPFQRTYAYTNEILYCNYSATDYDGDSIVAAEYNWSINTAQLPIYENKQTLNITKYSVAAGQVIECAVRVQDSTGLWSNYTQSNKLTVNNSAPSTFSLVSPDGLYTKSTATLRWNYADDIDNDEVSYYIILMNQTQFGTITILNDSSNSTMFVPSQFNNFSLNFNDNGLLKDGRYNWTVMACDSTETYGNNCTNATNNMSFVKDTTPPLAQILWPDNNSAVGNNFDIIVNASEANSPYVNITEVKAIFTSPSSYIVIENFTMWDEGGIYKYLINNTNNEYLQNGTYNLSINTTDTLGNKGNYPNINFTININTNFPILQIDYPPWKFREQFLNSSFNLNLSVFNATWVNYTIYKNGSSDYIMTDEKQFFTAQDYNFTNLFNISGLDDGFYIINLSGNDSIGSHKSKTAWFAIDTTPPSINDTADNETVSINQATTVWAVWENNTLNESDNRFGIKNVTFHYTATDYPYVIPSLYTEVSSGIALNDSNYSYTIPSNVFEKFKVIYWYSCAYDYAGNQQCSDVNNITVESIPPLSNAVMGNISMLEDEGNDTIVLNQFINDSNGANLSYIGVALPNGTLLYDPLDNTTYSSALRASHSGLSTIYTGLYNNATLIERAHQNLLTNPGFTYDEEFNDTNGSFVTRKPINWTLINNANWTTDDAYNNALYNEISASVNVSAKSYFYHEVMVVASETYSLSQYMKADTTTNSTPVVGRLHINWYDTNGIFIDSTLNLSSTLSRPTLTSEWARFNLTVTPPSGATTARIILDTDSNETWAFIDNVVFETEDYPTNYNIFDHTESHLTYPVQPIDGSLPYIKGGQGTIEVSLLPLWNTSDNITRYLFDIGTDSGFISAWFDGNDRLRFNYSDASILNLNVSAMNTSIFNTFAFTWNSSNVSLFWNNSMLPDNMSTTSGSFTSLNASGNIYIGTDKDSANHIDAIVDQLVIFDYAKNASEIDKDFITVPINGNDSDSAMTVTYLNFTYNSSTNALINVTPDAALLTAPAVNYHQRMQFFGTDGVTWNGSNVIDITVITDYNTFGDNVTVTNLTVTDYSLNGTIDNEVNNITYSTISNARLYNLSAPDWGLRNVIMDYVSATDSIITYSTVYNSTILSSTFLNSISYGNNESSASIQYSNISSGSYVNNGSVLYSNLINSSVYNNSQVINVNLTNSIVANDTILVNVNLTNATVDPSYIANSYISEGTSKIIDSRLINSDINNSEIYNVSFGSVLTDGSFNISNSIITDCLIESYLHDDILTNVSIQDANLTGNSKQDCRLNSGSVTVNQSGTLFVYTVGSESAMNARPFIEDIWNDTPDATLTIPTASTEYTGEYIDIKVRINDSNIGSSMNDSVNISIYFLGTGAAGLVNITNITDVNATNLTNNEYTYRYYFTSNHSDITVRTNVTDKFNNTDSSEQEYVTFTYDNSTCIDTTWTPDPSTVCSGTSFTQTSNCGNTQSATGTKYCSTGGGGSGGGGGSSNSLPLHCSNGIQDSTETAIDCGGSCYACSLLCSDGLLNGNEEKVDCGGDCIACKEPLTSYTDKTSCFNGRKDYNEDGIDCGGRCSRQCESPITGDVVKGTCFDGIKNQNELGVDCGGTCNACPAKANIPESDYGWVIWWIIIFVLIVLLLLLGLLVFKEKKKEHELEERLEHRTENDYAIASGHTIAGAATAGLYAKQPVRSAGPISDSIINLEKYIISSLDSGMKPSRIKETLVRSGWEASVVEVVMHKIMLSGDKLEEVEKFVQKQISKGLSDDQIRDKMVAAHWSSEIADLIIADVHKISKNASKLHDYVARKLQEGKSIDEIHQILVSIGWNENYIQKLLGKYR